MDYPTAVALCLPGIVPTREIDDAVHAALAANPNATCAVVQAAVLPLIPLVGAPPQYTLGAPYEPAQPNDVLGVDSGGDTLAVDSGGDVLGVDGGAPAVFPPAQPGATPVFAAALPPQPTLQPTANFVGAIILPGTPAGTADLLGVDSGGDVLGVDSGGDVLGVDSGAAAVPPAPVAIELFPWGLPRFQDSNPSPLDDWSIDNPGIIP